MPDLVTAKHRPVGSCTCTVVLEDVPRNPVVECGLLDELLVGLNGLLLRPDAASLRIHPIESCRS